MRSPPPGIVFGHGSVCAHEGGADEGRRVYGRGDEPAGVWERHGAARRGWWLDGDAAGREPLHAAPHPRTPRGGTGARRREGQGGQAWAWARGPWAKEGGSRRRRRGGSRGCEGGPVGRGRWEDWGRARGGRTNEARGRGGGGAAQVMVAGDNTRQFAVGHWRARGAFPGAVITEGASRGIGQLAAGQSARPGRILGGSTPNGAPRSERETPGGVARGPAAGGWVDCCLRAIYPVSVCTHHQYMRVGIYICIYTCMHRQIDR